MTKYNWKAIPKQYNWVGYNQHGIIRAFRERPRAMDGFWADCDEEFTEWVGELPTVLLWEDWKDSLEERPKPAKRWSLVMGIDGLSTVWDNKMDVALYGAYGDSTAALEKVVEILNEYEEEREDD